MTNQAIFLVCAFSLITGAACLALVWFYISAEKRKLDEARRRERRAMLRIMKDFKTRQEDLMILQHAEALENHERQRAEVLSDVEAITEKQEKNYQVLAKAVFELKGGEVPKPKSVSRGLQARRQQQEERFIEKNKLKVVARVG